MARFTSSREANITSSTQSPDRPLAQPTPATFPIGIFQVASPLHLCGITNEPTSFTKINTTGKLFARWLCGSIAGHSYPGPYIKIEGLLMEKRYAHCTLYSLRWVLRPASVTGLEVVKPNSCGYIQGR